MNTQDTVPGLANVNVLYQTQDNLVSNNGEANPIADQNIHNLLVLFDNFSLTDGSSCQSQLESLSERNISILTDTSSIDFHDKLTPNEHAVYNIPPSMLLAIHSEQNMNQMTPSEFESNKKDSKVSKESSQLNILEEETASLKVKSLIDFLNTFSSDTNEVSVPLSLLPIISIIYSEHKLKTPSKFTVKGLNQAIDDYLSKKKSN